jgi:hypothetical protein
MVIIISTKATEACLDIALLLMDCASVQPATGIRQASPVGAVAVLYPYAQTSQYALAVSSNPKVTWTNQHARCIHQFTKMAPWCAMMYLQGRRRRPARQLS